MIEYGLKVNEATGKVRYVMVQKDGNVQAETPYESAVWMLKRGKARTSGKIEGYPLTADGVYFFEIEDDTSSEPPEAAHLPLKGKALAEDGEETPSVAADAVTPEAQAAPAGEDLNDDADAVDIGADGLPLLAGDGTKRRRRRVKDVVCE